MKDNMLRTGLGCPYL